MSNIESLMKNTLLDWKLEKEYQEKRLKDQQATASDIEYAKKRIAEAEFYIKKIKEIQESGELVSKCGGIKDDTPPFPSEDDKRDDDFGVWMFKHGKGIEVAKRLEEDRNRIEEAAKREKTSKDRV